MIPNKVTAHGIMAYGMMELKGEKKKKCPFGRLREVVDVAVEVMTSVPLCVESTVDGLGGRGGRGGKEEGAGYLPLEDS